MNVKDELARTQGVGDVAFLGSRDYSMRIWLDPNKLASRQLTAGDVIQAVQEQNVQVAAGRLGQPPVPAGNNIPFQLTINTQGRLTSEDAFKKIIVKTGAAGQNVFLKELVRDERGIELGAKNYDVNSYLDGKPCATLAVFQLPGSNALDTAAAVKEKMAALKLPPDLTYEIYYDTTVFVDESIHEVYKTLYEAFILVFIVVLVFLQDWRATVIPMIAVPVSLVGTLAVMAGLGFSLNNLSLFGLVLAIGIVVDDAIVVVENVERYLGMGHDSREASRLAMAEVSGPVIAIALVLCAVFVPTALMAGISGEFFRQFALTIAASTIISAFNSLTLSPALATIMFKGHGGGQEHGEHGHSGHGEKQAMPRLGVVILAALIGYFWLAPILAGLAGIEVAAEHGAHGAAEAEHASSLGIWVARLVAVLVAGAAGWFLAALVNRILGAFFAAFNWVFDRIINGYGRTVGAVLRVSLIALAVYGGLMFLTYLGFQAVPVGFIPEQDKGYLVVNVQLPDGASLDRTDAVVKRLSEIARSTDGVDHTIDLPGYSVVLSTNISNVGGLFVILKPFEERKGNPELGAPAITRRLRAAYQEITAAQVAVFGAPAIDGLGTTGGFKLQVQDRGGGGFRELQGAVQNLADQGNADPRLAGLFTTFSIAQPQLFVEIDREKLKAQKCSLKDVNLTLQAYLGSYYINDVTLFNRNWQVNLQADAPYRLRVEDIGRLEVRNADGKRVPLRTLVNVKNTSGPAVVNHFKIYPSAEVNGGTAPGVSTGQAIAIMEQLSKDSLPSTMSTEWTEITLQQIIASQDLLTKLAFPLAVVFVFLVLAAQYESWSLPLSIILIVPMCLLASIVGVWLCKLDNNIFTQIGLVVLIGLAAKNAILIVEFAKQRQDQGLARFEATIDACRLRLRPILMTSFAFILGVLPLVLSAGAGAEMRFSLGIAVFSGMLGVTVFGLFFTPVFYSVVMWFSGGKPAATPSVAKVDVRDQKTLEGDQKH